MGKGEQFPLVFTDPCFSQTFLLSRAQRHTFCSLFNPLEFPNSLSWSLLKHNPIIYSSKGTEFTLRTFTGVSCGLLSLLVFLTSFCKYQSDSPPFSQILIRYPTEDIFCKSLDNRLPNVRISHLGKILKQKKYWQPHILFPTHFPAWGPAGKLLQRNHPPYPVFQKLETWTCATRTLIPLFRQHSPSHLPTYSLFHVVCFFQGLKHS